MLQVIELRVNDFIAIFGIKLQEKTLESIMGCCHKTFLDEYEV